MSLGTGKTQEVTHCLRYQNNGATLLSVLKLKGWAISSREGHLLGSIPRVHATLLLRSSNGQDTWFSSRQSQFDSGSEYHTKESV